MTGKTATILSNKRKTNCSYSM